MIQPIFVHDTFLYPSTQPTPFPPAAPEPVSLYPPETSSAPAPQPPAWQPLAIQFALWGARVLMPPPLMSAPSAADSLKIATERGLKAKIYYLDAEAKSELEKVNARLARSGQAPVDFMAVTREIETIANDPNRTDKEKRRDMNEIRKRLGLKKGEMKALFTKRLEKIYAETKGMLEQNIDVFRSEKDRAEKRYGKDSPQALAAAQRLEEVVRVNQPLLQKLDQNQKLYHSMYKPGGCIKKMFKGIGNVFKGVLKTALGVVTTIFNPKNWIRPSFWKNFLLPVAMTFIPGLGPLAATAMKWGSAVYQGIKTVSALAKGRFMEALAWAGGALTETAGLGAGTLSRGAARTKAWMDQGVMHYQRLTEWYREVKSWPNMWRKE